MNRQRKIVITVTYNDLGVIVDTKAEELNSSAQPDLQPACNQLATDCISRQQAIDAIDCINGVEEVLRSLPPVQPEPPWIPVSERLPEIGATVLFATLMVMSM